MDVSSVDSSLGKSLQNVVTSSDMINSDCSNQFENVITETNILNQSLVLHDKVSNSYNPLDNGRELPYIYI